jgi:hypothetical protein
VSGRWNARRHRRGAGSSGVPVVSVGRPRLWIEEIHFATSRHGSGDVHFFYRNGNRHPLMPGRSMRWWGKGSKITDPEWQRRPLKSGRACFSRKAPIAMSVRVKMVTSSARSVSLTVLPTLDRSEDYLQETTVSFTYPAGAADHWVDIVTDGEMPDEIGRYMLRLNWRITGGGVRLGGPSQSTIRVYSIYGKPVDPDHISTSATDTGRELSQAEGTLSGTKKRFDHVTRLIGGRRRRHPVSTDDELANLYWALHKGINDTPGAPPYFDAKHDQHLTVDGANGTDIPVEDQWLALVRTSRPHWNDASCIGHVQVAKTMLASIGLSAIRTWVLPHTSRLPDGTTVSFADRDLYELGENTGDGGQEYTFDHGGNSYVATPKLMEPRYGFENFEACMLSPSGRFLTGGYATRSHPQSVRDNKGFGSAAELLRWWSNTTRSGFGKRFMAWLYLNRSTREAHLWDVDGNHYEVRDYVNIRDNGKELPPP